MKIGTSHNVSYSGAFWRRSQLLFVINKFRCPNCGHRTITWRRGSRWGGIWECLNEACGTSDSCEHERYHVETGENWPMSPEDTSVSTYEVYVCDTCDETIEDRDPVLDRLEAAYED